MRFFIIFLLIILHISNFINCYDPEPLLQPESIKFPDNDLKDELIIKMGEILKIHQRSGHNPIEYLIKSEFLFLYNSFIRTQVIFECYEYITGHLKEENLNIEEAEKLELQLIEILTDTVKNVDKLINELKNIYQKYDNEDFDLPIREPSTFRSLELIKKSYELVKKVYFIAKEHIDNSKIDDEMKKKLIITLKNRTILYIYSEKILLLKMFYDVGDLRKLKMRFIVPGIYYLLIFETGIIKRLMEKRLEDNNEFFNKFLKNYINSIEELIDKILFHIKEDELPMEVNETLYGDLIKMRKDYNEIINNILSVEGYIIKGVEL